MQTNIKNDFKIIQNKETNENIENKETNKSNLNKNKKQVTFQDDNKSESGSEIDFDINEFSNMIS